MGYQSEWIETDAEHRSVSYSNLWPGDYTLQIRGSNHQGRWSTDQISIPIIVLPQFWQTKWFILVIVIGVGSSIYLLYKLRIGRVRKEKRILQRACRRTGCRHSQVGRSWSRAHLDLRHRKGVRPHPRSSFARVDAFAFGIGFFDSTSNTIEVGYMIEGGIRQEPFRYSMEEKDRPAVWCVANKTELLTNTNQELLKYFDVIAPVKSGRQCNRFSIYH